MRAQRAFEENGHVIYENRLKKRVDLGPGFSPVVTPGGKVAMIRGRFFDYGEDFDCRRKETRNWVALYDPETRAERTIFDRALSFGRDGMEFCIFSRMQLSPAGSTLYLVSIVYATSGALAIVPLPEGTVKYVAGVDDVWIIESGPHRGELLYQQRRECGGPRAEDRHPCYPLVHARADGRLVHVIAEEYPTDGIEKAPRTTAYLRRIGGRITVDGRPFPN